MKQTWRTRQLTLGQPEVVAMRIKSTIAVHCCRALLLGLLALGGPVAAETRAEGEAKPPVAIQFSLDRPLDASAAPFVLATTSGLFGAEGLAVNTNVASGSPDAIARVAAGSSEFALVDIWPYRASNNLRDALARSVWRRTK